MCGGYEDPFRDYTANGQNKPQLSRPGTDAANIAGKLAREPWSSMTYREIAQGLTGGVDSLNTGSATVTARRWAQFSTNLTELADEFESTINRISEWDSASGRAARKAIDSYTKSIRQLADNSTQMSDVVTNLVGVVDVIKETLPSSYEDYDAAMNDAGPSDSERASSEEHMDDVARQVMNSVYVPGATDTARGAPTFGDPAISPKPGSPNTNTAGPASTTRGGNPTSTPSATSGLPGARTPSSNADTLKDLSRNMPKSPDLGSTVGLLGNQASNIGKGLANTAKQAATKTLGTLKKGTKPANTVTKKSPKPSTGNKSGRSPGGGSNGGKGSGPGSKLQSPSLKDNIRNATKIAQAAEQKLLGNAANSRGATPMAGSPGGAGARGAGGGDKEHKTSKFLQTRLNGELLLGKPVVVTQSVVDTVGLTMRESEKPASAPAEYGSDR